MEPRLLRYFQAVAEELSFSRAARRLHVAQPALSRAVQALEAQVGSALLERTRRWVRLTPAGAVLLREAALLLERGEETLRRVRRTAAGQEGELRLGYIGPPTRDFLGRLLAAYARRHPRVAIHLEERTPERVWEMVAAGRLSIGLTRPPAAPAALGLEVLTLREERFCAIVPPDHPLHGPRSVAWRRLSRHPLVLLARREGATSHDAILAACHEAGFTPRIAHTPSLLGTVLRYVESGAGVGVLPACAAGEPALTGLRFPTLSPVRTIPLALLWPARRAEPTALAFRDLVRERLRSGARAGFSLASPPDAG
jgi:DNA-binding transcriptional LysR family regulator